MPRRDATGPVTLSVLDRLIDRDPKTRSEVPFTRAQSLRELKLALKRDLEWLLNTRKTIDPEPDSARETIRSVYQYGFPDISSKSVLSSRDHGDLVREMELAITVFEPRLKRPKVRMEQLERFPQCLILVVQLPMLLAHDRILSGLVGGSPLEHVY